MSEAVPIPFQLKQWCDEKFMYHNNTTQHTGKFSGSFETQSLQFLSRDTQRIVSTMVVCVMDTVAVHFCGEESANQIQVEREEDRVKKHSKQREHCDDSNRT